MKTRIAAAAVTLAILAATYGVFFVIFSLGAKETPKAANGFLDLSAWRFEDDGVVALDGEWEFYPDRLLDPEDFAAVSADGSETSAGRIEVPGAWTSRMSAMGAGTYRLRVQVGDTASVYGLKTSSIQISNRIFVNGRVVGGSGHPAEDGQSYQAVNRPFAAYFELKPGWNEIVVHVANHEFPASGGINESIFLGHAAQIAALRDKATAHDWIKVTAFLIMGLYFIGLYTQRKDDTSLIAFGIACVFTAVFTSSRGERVMFDVFGQIPFPLFLRIQLASAVVAGVGFLLFVYAAFRPYCSKRLVRSGTVAGAVLTVLVIGFVPQIATGLFRQIVTTFSTFPLLYAVYVFVLAAFRKVEGSLYLIVAAVALNMYALVQNLNVYFGVPVYSMAPFEPFLLLLMLALLMSLRFSNAFRKIEELSVRLLKADKLKDDFLARTSHEFKSPLHGIMHISRSMLDDVRHPPTAEQKEKLQLISDITGRLSQLVYDILDLSKLKQGELAIDLTPVDVRAAAGMQISIYKYLCADRNIRLENRVPSNLPLALADESRFGQIIGNLLDNAVKYTENGSIVVSAAERGGMLEISVADTGEGIDERHIPYLFEAYQSFDAAPDRRGFGLGLPIVKQLVELQNGSISVSSLKGIGTTFTFTLPIANDGNGSGGGRPAASPRAGGHPAKEPEYSFATPLVLNQNGKHTILIVDDQFVNLKVLIDALTPFGHNIIAVKNGYEALEQIDKPNRIDLVVLDMMMPGLSGCEVCREIRKTHSMLELPVLMVTAAIGPQDKLAAFEAGANDFLPKPFEMAELKARIGSLLALKESLAKAVDLEVAFLQSQIKPHFLYNVLNSIIASSYTNAEQSRKLTADLADYLRGSFRFSHIEKRVKFEEEFSLIRTYVEIEKARFKDRLRFECDIAEEMYGVSIPPLLLQPLVENAIRHGIGNRIEGGMVKLSAFRADGECWFVIEDDGVGMEREVPEELPVPESDKRRGVGLLNIKKRLKYEYGSNLHVESEAGRGTKVTVRIPAEPA